MIALVTGASSGIGEATARRIAREPGAMLILVARREDRLKALADELGCGAKFVAVDLTDDDAPAKVAEAVGDELHLLVNNAGAAWRGRFGETGWEHVHRHMALNFDAQVRLTEALLPALRRSVDPTFTGTPPLFAFMAAGAGLRAVAGVPLVHHWRTERRRRFGRRARFRRRRRFGRRHRLGRLR